METVGVKEERETGGKWRLLSVVVSGSAMETKSVFQKLHEPFLGARLGHEWRTCSQTRNVCDQRMDLFRFRPRTLGAQRQKMKLKLAECLKQIFNFVVNLFFN